VETIRLQRIPPFKTLDAFRGFAAIWVVMLHSCDRWIPDASSPYLKEPLYAFSTLGQLGVMIFFVISGYCITAAAYSAMISGKSLGRYSFERVRRIYPPYLAALVVTVLSLLTIDYANAHHLIGAVHHLQNLPLSPRYWIANLFLLQYELHTPMVNVVFWSLGYEVAFYFFIGLFLKGGQWIAAKRNHRAGTLFFVCCVGISTVLTLTAMLMYGKPCFPIDAWHQFSIGAILFFVLELKPATVSGYTTGFRWVVLVNAFAVAIFTLLYVVFRQVGMVDYGHPSSKVRSGLCLGFAVLLIGLRRVDEQLSSSRILHPLMWVGAFSYSVYLAHPIVLPYADILCRKAGLNGSLYWITFWIEVTVSIVVGWIFFQVVERHFISKRQVQRLAAEHVAVA
jgi:peptidoglycan/LPS O-acetylase OafA/YrhL